MSSLMVRQVKVSSKWLFPDSRAEWEKTDVGGVQEAISTERSSSAPPVISVAIELLKRHTHTNSDLADSFDCSAGTEKLQRAGNKRFPTWFGPKRKGGKTE